jgi:D-alanyl-lipoteichoic acid acyltransferase DltB (MBOAT superfamily)
MLFNSIDFAIFLPIVFILYWFVTDKNLKLQNLLMIAASYLFYGWWDWRFLSLILFSTLVDYSVGLKLKSENNQTKRKVLLWASILANLGFLGFFKYYNFFVDNFIAAFSFFGTEIKTNSLNIILPVGISFYTFQTLSYTIDVYRRKLEPTNDIVAFAAYVSFFPQLVAGPIERAVNLLPQFRIPRTFNYEKAVDGMRQILWGFFKKVVIADNCARFADQIFMNSDKMNGSALMIGALFFTFQIYGDFSGYSDIAIGTSRLFGFNLMKNFAFPYFSRDFGEFWRKWHISLSTWFRDYLYIPLGGSRGSKLLTIRNTFLIFMVSGFWHGPNWTFIIWGLLNAIYFLPLLLANKNRINLDVIAQNSVLPSLKELRLMGTTFFFTVIAWIFFRADTINHAISYVDGIFSPSIIERPNFIGLRIALTTIGLIFVFVIIEWIGRKSEYAIEKIDQIPNRWLRFACYYSISFSIIYFGEFGENQFIYFQF